MTDRHLAVSGPQGLRVLRLYHLYRLVIGFALVLLSSSGLDGHLLDITHAHLFELGSWAYLTINIIASASMHRTDRLLPVFSLALFDVAQLSLLFYAAGGTPSGLGNLIIAAVAVANILLRGRIGIVIAAVAATGIIYLTFYLSLSNAAASNQYMHAGILGALCFAAAIFVQGISRRARASETLAEERAGVVANLEEINALIIQRMRTGVLVLNQDNQVVQANHAAVNMTGYDALIGRTLNPLFPELMHSLKLWESNPALHSAPIQSPISATQLQANFVKLQNHSNLQILIFLEDTAQLTQQAQQLKLASLGRLTAGIAHEIRNPLGAISHAAQLLHESPALDAADVRLTQIIQDQSRRMNTVIENILQLSRRRQTEPQQLDLHRWLQDFIQEFTNNSQAQPNLHLIAKDTSLWTRMDPDQLDQVVNNLVENGLRYSAQQHQHSQVWLHLYRHRQTGLPTLEIQDDGPGIALEDQPRVFEPFFTTENKGTGLGLYISRELCESNQARLDFTPRDKGGSCFRITFAHPSQASA